MSKRTLAIILAVCIVVLGILSIFVLYFEVWNKKETLDLYEYVNEKVLIENPKVSNQSATISDASTNWLSPTGTLGYTVSDFDNDGDDELLVARSVFVNGQTDAHIYLDMYEQKHGNIKLAATKKFEPYLPENYNAASLCTNLTADVSIHINVINVSGKNYIMCEEAQYYSAYSDGSTQNYWILEYTGNSYNYVASFSQTSGGSAYFEYTGYKFSAGSPAGSEIYYRDYSFDTGGKYNHFGTALSDYFADFDIKISDYAATSENPIYRYFSSILSPEIRLKKCCNIYNSSTTTDYENFKFDFIVE